MSFPGIPDSLDRQEFQRRVSALLACAVAVVAIGVLIAGLLGPSQEKRRRMNEGAALPAVPPAEEFSDALTAAKQYVLQQLNPERAVEVAWIAERHEGNRGWYRFEGTLHVRDNEDQIHTLLYQVVVNRDQEGHWRLEEINVTPTGSSPSGK